MTCLPVYCCSKRPKKVVHKRISSSGDELQNQVDSGWVNVSAEQLLLCCADGELHIACYIAVKAAATLGHCVRAGKPVTVGSDRLDTLGKEAHKRSQRLAHTEARMLPQVMLCCICLIHLPVNRHLFIVHYCC